MKLTNLLSLALLFCAATWASNAQAITLKIATVVPDGTNWMQEFKTAADEVATKTENRVKLRFYAGGIMGSDKSVLRKMRVGQLHGGALGIGALSDFYKGANIYATPFLFKDLAQVKASRSLIDPILKRELAKKGIVLLGLSEGGFAKMMSDSAIDGPESLKNKKVWIPEGDIISQTVFNQAGISPVALPVSDVYTGLQTGLLNTITINLSAAIALQWHSKISHVSNAPVVFVMGAMAISKRAFDKIKPQDQQVLESAVSKAFARLDISNHQDEAKAEQALQQLGVKFSPMSESALKSWQQHSAKAIKEMIAKQETDGELLTLVREHLQQLSNK